MLKKIHLKASVFNTEDTTVNVIVLSNKYKQTRLSLANSNKVWRNEYMT